MRKWSLYEVINFANSTNIQKVRVLVHVNRDGEVVFKERKCDKIKNQKATGNWNPKFCRFKKID